MLLQGNEKGRGGQRGKLTYEMVPTQASTILWGALLPGSPLRLSQMESRKLAIITSYQLSSDTGCSLKESITLDEKVPGTETISSQRVSQYNQQLNEDQLDPIGHLNKALWSLFHAHPPRPLSDYGILVPESQILSSLSALAKLLSSVWVT